MKISKEENLLIKGPCVIRVLRGSAKVQGIEVNYMELSEGESFTVYTESEAEIELTCEANKMLSLGWEDRAKEISEGGGKVIVLGFVDSGKSYFVKMVSNMNRKFLVLDSDVGQNSFLPSFISLFKEKEVLSLKFFGDVTPSVNPSLHVEQVISLSDFNNLIIDTDGWLRGFKAMKHKFDLIELVNPDYVVVFSEKIKDRLPKNIHAKVKMLKQLPLRIEKSRERRIRFRVEAYKKYFNSSKTYVVDSGYLFGKRLYDSIYSAWGEIVSFGECLGTKMDVKGALLGVVKKGKVVGAGIIREVKEGQILISTPLEEFDYFILGRIYLDSEFREGRITTTKC
jgi:polynucleotide 5'-hydroxyl-kinase GRC3/NOL9